MIKRGIDEGYHHRRDSSNNSGITTATSGISSKKELQNAIDEVKNCLREFILNCPHASERIVLATWQRVTYRYQYEWDLLEEGLKTYFHANPRAYRNQIKELYIEVEDEIRLNKRGRR